MKYISTRGYAEEYTASQAIKKGICNDRGLFVPKKFPKVSLEEIEKMKDSDYKEIALNVLKNYLTDYTEEELKSTFISVISHELKTPVALIKGYVGTLRRDDVSWNSEIVQDSLEVIEEEADRLTELIENLLDASRLQAGGLSLNQCDLAFGVFARKMLSSKDYHSIIKNIHII